MPSDSPVQEESVLLAYEPERYWAIWQRPEGRYAYSIDSEQASWLIALGTQAAGEACLASDARQNGRPLSDYRLDELTLPDAFAAARAQPTPFLSSHGKPVHHVLGVLVIAQEPDGWATIRHIPL